MEQIKTSLLRQALDVVEELPPEDQVTLVELIRYRLLEQQAEVAPNAAATLQAVREGLARYGSVEDFEGDPSSEPVASEQSEAPRRSLEIVLRDGRPTAVILDIGEYQKMLERLEDMEDLAMLEEMREKPLEFRRIEDFLAEYQPGV